MSNYRAFLPACGVALFGRHAGLERDGFRRDMIDTILECVVDFD